MGKNRGWRLRLFRKLRQNLFHQPIGSGKKLRKRFVIHSNFGHLILRNSSAPYGIGECLRAVHVIRRNPGFDLIVHLESASDDAFRHGIAEFLRFKQFLVNDRLKELVVPSVRPIIIEPGEVKISAGKPEMLCDGDTYCRVNGVIEVHGNGFPLCKNDGFS